MTTSSDRRGSWTWDYGQGSTAPSVTEIGATFEGIRRAHGFAYDGTIRDSAYFSIIASHIGSAIIRC